MSWWNIGEALIGGGFSALGAERANREARKAASRMMGFQREMFDRSVQLSNTAVQRRMADLKAAGINPMLAYQSAADVPKGGQGATYTPQNVAGQGVSSAMQARRSRAEVQLLRDQGHSAREAGNLAKNNAHISLMQRQVVNEQINQEMMRTEMVRKGLHVTNQELKALSTKGGRSAINAGAILRQLFGQGGAGSLAHSALSLRRTLGR